ncbi:MAG: hypothetical protein QOI41_6763 [Myxococcales bacterium]|nr:hypothetical protein [Myxococcales bacterium]
MSTSQRLVEAFTANIGRPSTIALLLVLIGLWVAWNSFEKQHGGYVADPPPFFWLQGIIALYAALISTFVLATQNREKRHGEQRAYLELQINLLAEQKTAKVIELLEETLDNPTDAELRISEEASAPSEPGEPSAPNPARPR